MNNKNKDICTSLAAEPPAPAPAIPLDLDALLSPEGAYELGTGQEDGAQLVDLCWWAPVHGCDTLENLLDRIRRRILPHLRPPIAGIDVPGADGDYGGLQELCDAEGVDVRIGAPLLKRARESWGAAQPPVPAPAADPLQGFAATLVASQRPMDPDVAAALTPKARWDMYDGEPAPADHVPDAGDMVPADGEAEELAQWLEGFVSDVEAEDYTVIYDHNRLRRAAALLRQLPPEGLDPASYDAGGLVQIQRANQNPEAWAIRCGVSCMSTAGEWDIEPMPSHRTDEWLANHHWPSVAAAWAALQQARQQEVGDE